MFLGDWMIKVKTLLLKQVLERTIYILIISIIAMLLILTSILGIRIIEIKLKKGDFRFDYTEVSGKNLITKIIENEFPLSSTSEIFLATELDKQENETFVSQTELKVDFSTRPKLEYQLPDKYEVIIGENGGIQIGNCKVTNYSKLNLNFEELSKVEKTSKFDNAKFLIFHTHATECYNGCSDEGSNYRTLNKELNMVEVGEELSNQLEARGFEVTHDDTLHDYPNYNGAYQASLQTVQTHIKKHNYDFVLDIHRDALSSNLNYAPTIDVSGEKAAQLMFVIGTDACGLKHDEWMENLKLAIMIQNRANEMYPGLFRNLNLSASRYNQHVSEGAFIIEVGATGNSLEEAKNAVTLLANVMDSFNT